MKILVFAHRFDVGGSQVNTVDLSTALRDLYGHEVVIFATPGAMVEVAEKRGLRFIPAPDVSTYPSLTMMRALRQVVQREQPDLVHVWDWWQCLDSYYSVYMTKGIPMVLSDMVSEGISRFLPKSLPTTFGTPELVDQAIAAGRRRAKLLLPPVDIHLNAPDIVDGQLFREQFGIKNEYLTLVTVSRLTMQLKSESLRRTIDAVGLLGNNLPVQFVIVGDGNARSELEYLAAKTNKELGRTAVILTGELLDPRPAYAAADIVVGMGGAALRGMAFGKPAIVVGEHGFSKPLTPETADWFYYYGIYGRGDGRPSNEQLASDIRAYAEHRDELSVCGGFSRNFVVANFSVEAVCAQLEELFNTTLKDRQQTFDVVADGLRTAAIFFGGKYVPETLRRSVKRYENQRLAMLRGSRTRKPGST